MTAMDKQEHKTLELLLTNGMGPTDHPDFRRHIREGWQCTELRSETVGQGTRRTKVRLIRRVGNPKDTI